MSSAGGTRAFLAVNPGAQLRDELSIRVDAVCDLLAGCSALRWTRPEQWHLTLQFLGNWPEPRLSQLEAALGQLEVGPAIDLFPTGLGAFPDLRHPRVLFLHMGSDGRAEDLAGILRGRVQEVWPEGPQDTRPFRAHLTLARVKGRLSASQVQILEKTGLAGLPVSSVREFQLVTSQLARTGARHSVRARFPLDSS